MGFEIDYIPAGNGEKNGDAIILRTGNLHGPRSEQLIIVIDGGYVETGEKIIHHLKTYYDTESIDIVVATHPDADHIGGLKVLLERCPTTLLMMHLPWEHADDIKDLFQNGQLTKTGLEKTFAKSLQGAKDLETLAKEKQIHIVEPFQGITLLDGSMHILGPSEEYYKTLIPMFRSTPKAISALEQLFAPIKKATDDVVEWIEDRFDIDLLDDDEDSTSAENNTSVIMLLNIDDQGLLFTGDAGKTALLDAVEYAQAQAIQLDKLNFFHVPHHGSRRNLSSKVLSHISARTAFVSATGESSKHPSKKVTNALIKNNSRVFVNRKKTLRHSLSAPDRVGWGAASGEPFHDKVEK